MAFPLASAARAAPVHSSSGLALLLAFGLALSLYWDTARAVVAAWTNPTRTYEHGFVVLLVCAFMFVHYWREHRASLVVRPAPTAVIAMLVASAAWAAGDLAALQAVRFAAFAAVVALVAPCVVGWQSARVFALPAALFSLAVPLWDPLLPVLQKASAIGAALVVSATGATVLREGVLIHIGSGTFFVEPACGGLSFVLMATFAATLFVHFHQLPRRWALPVICGAVLAAAAANVLRIAVVVLAGDRTNMNHFFIRVEHSSIGWLVFLVTLFAYLLLARSLTAAAPRATTTGPDPAASSARTASDRPLAALLAASVFALAFGPAVVAASRVDGGAPTTSALPLPAGVGEWARVSPVLDYRPAFLGPHAEGEATYRAGAAERFVYAYVADYAFPLEGRKAVSTLNSVIDRGWLPLERTRREVAPGLALTETHIRAADGREKLVWHWYVIGGRNVAGELPAKLYAAWTQVRGDPAVGVVVLALDVPPGRVDAARATLARFASDAEPALAAALEASRGRR